MINKYLGAFFLAIVLLISCKKETRNLAQIEDETITAYLKNNNLTGFIKDTSGYYYQIQSPGTGEEIKYSTFISFSQKTTSINENVNYENSIYIPISNYTGYVSPVAWRETMIKVKKGAIIRIITPSYLAFGKTGFSTTIPGNAILDTKITVANNSDRPAYEETLIKDFLTTNKITALKDPSGLYYQIITAGTGKTPISSATVKVAYTGRLLTGSIFDQATTAAPLSIALTSVIEGWQTGVPLIKEGGKIRLFIPSRFGYGSSGQSSIPPNSILDFDIELIEVTN
jgi:FKBP-type peptidyl-prolyl cis-trans isomerase FkpA